MKIKKIAKSNRIADLVQIIRFLLRQYALTDRL